MLDQNYEAPGVAADLYPSHTRIGKLELRLENGWRIIEAEQAAGEPTEELETHFLVLLREYEEAYDLAHTA